MPLFAWLNCFGGKVLDLLRAVLYLSTMFCVALWMAVQPRTWVYPVRDRLAKQILFAGVEAIPFTTVVAALMGATVYLQCLIWLDYTGQVDLSAQMVATLLMQVAAPFLSTFIVIGASASAITTEMATMKTTGEVALLESQGIDIFHYMVVPRMIGLALCVFGLSLICVVVAMIAAALGFILVSGSTIDAVPFFKSLLEALSSDDLLSISAQTILPGLLMGAICCYQGLRVGGASTEVPKAVSRAILHSISAAVAVTAMVMLVTYFQ
jgi:phospholipid/cholesterol/gamma-HCH transport system permease protein